MSFSVYFQMKRKKNQMKRRKGSREKTMISDLPSDLVEEILSRVPLKSLRKVRLTCTKWNTLSKTDKFMKMHIGKGAAAAREGESQMIVLMDYNLFLMSIVVNGDPFTEPKGKLTCLNNQQVSFFTPRVYCYASWKTVLGLWFGIRIWGKQGGSNQDILSAKTADWTCTVMLSDTWTRRINLVVATESWGFWII